MTCFDSMLSTSYPVSSIVTQTVVTPTQDATQTKTYGTAKRNQGLTVEVIQSSFFSKRKKLLIEASRKEN